jgi:hypothetical protein
VGVCVWEMRVQEFYGAWCGCECMREGTCVCVRRNGYVMSTFGEETVTETDGGHLGDSEAVGRSAGVDRPLYHRGKGFPLVGPDKGACTLPRYR